MAIVTTSIEPTQKLFSFSGFTIGMDRSAAARGQLIATARNQAVVVAAGGNQQEIEVDIVLPGGYAYVMTDYALNIAGVLNNFDLFGELTIFDAVTSSQRTVDIPLGLVCPGKAGVFPGTTNAMQTYTPNHMYSGILLPATSSSQVKVFASFLNATADDNAYVVDIVARFLQYDISQANHYAVNTPIPVR